MGSTASICFCFEESMEVVPLNRILNFIKSIGVKKINFIDYIENNKTIEKNYIGVESCSFPSNVIDYRMAIDLDRELMEPNLLVETAGELEKYFEFNIDDPFSLFWFTIKSGLMMDKNYTVFEGSKTISKSFIITYFTECQSCVCRLEELERSYIDSKLISEFTLLLENTFKHKIKKVDLDFR